MNVDDVSHYVRLPFGKDYHVKHAVSAADLVLLATIKVCAESYPHIAIGRVMELAESHGDLIRFDEWGQPWLNDEQLLGGAEPAKKKCGAEPSGDCQESDLSGRGLDTSGFVGVSGAYPDASDGESVIEYHDHSAGIPDTALSDLQHPSDDGVECSGFEAGSGDLSRDEAWLLDSLAALGDQAKVSSKQLLDRASIPPPFIAGSVMIGKMLGSLENRGYVTRVREKPSALWRALEDSRGNPPPSNGGAA